MRTQAFQRLGPGRRYSIGIFSKKDTANIYAPQIQMLEDSAKRELPLAYPQNSKFITPHHFYQTPIREWTRRKARPLSVQQLGYFGRGLTETKVFKSGKFVAEEMSIRFAHRLREMQQMPFCLVNNPHLLHVYEQYYEAFEYMRKLPSITNVEDNKAFCNWLDNLLDNHRNFIPDIILGVSEQMQIFSTVEAGRIFDTFTRSMMSSRISRRVLAEQYISMTRGLESAKNNKENNTFIGGKLFFECNAGKIIKYNSSRITKILEPAFPPGTVPEVEIEGESDYSFAYVPSHLNFILGEILRNSLEASASAYLNTPDNQRPPRPPPVSIAVSRTPENIFMRFSDQGGGIPTNRLNTIWSFAKIGEDPSGVAELMSEDLLHNVHTILHSHHSVGGVRSPGLKLLSNRGPHVRMGMGLALARIYAEYWRGTLEIFSIEGYGCDVLLRIPRLGTQVENLRLIPES